MLTTTKSNKRVATLIYDNLCMFEFACVAEIFGLKRPELGDNWYTFDTISLDDKAVSTQYQGQLTPTLPIADITLVDTLIIPGWISAQSPVPAPLIEKLIEAHNAGTRLLSICSGVFVLAATGLLDDKQATTHWKYTEQLATRYPKIDVLNDVLYVDHDTIMTSAGSAAGLDLCLHMVRKDFGSKIVNTVARRLVIPPLREGNQAQFIEQPIPTSSRSALAPVLDKMKENLTNSHSIKSLAQSINLSERTFLRRFKQSTGTTPGEWLTDARLQYARELLETTDLPIDLLAQQSGFGTATTLRHHFRHRLNISPAAYRKRFHQGY